MTDRSFEELGAARSPWVYRAPLLAAALLIVVINGVNLDRQVRAAVPREPWESAEVVESWRSLQGMPVYDPSPSRHATHMYGALAPWLQGEVFRWTGPNNTAGRVISLVSSLVLVLALASALRGERSAWSFAVAGALFLGMNFRSGNYFAENRPDMTALMLAALGMLLMGFGHEARRWWAVVLGSAGLVAGFFFKQTATMFAAVPVVALVLRGRRPTRAEVFFALLPLGVMSGVIVTLKTTSPVVYHYMIVVPKSFAVNWPGTVREAWNLLLDSPLFLLLFGEWVVNDGASLRNRPRLLWVLAALVVTIPFSAISSAKAGGTLNSLVPVLLTMMAFCTLRLPRLTRLLGDSSARPHARMLLGSFLALLMLMTTFPHPTRKNNLFVARSGRDAAYRKVIARVAGLPGMVLCPEDPTIPVFARRHAERNIYLEYDAHAVAGEWPKSPPEEVLSEIRAADYVVDAHDWWQDLLDAATLKALGFESVDDAAFEPDYYRLWRRVR